MKIWDLGYPLDVRGVFTGLCESTHYYHSLLHFWDQDVQADGTLIYLKRRSCFRTLPPKQNIAEALSFRGYCQVLLVRKTAEEVLGPGGETCTRRLVCWLITVFYEEATEIFYNVLESRRMKLMSPNCKCLPC